MIWRLAFGSLNIARSSRVMLRAYGAAGSRRQSGIRPGTSLRRQRAGIRRPELHPLGELRPGAHVLGVDAEPACSSRPRISIGYAFVVATSPSDSAGSTRTRIPPWPLAATAMLPPTRNAEAAEHLLLGHAGVVADQVADALGEQLVVRHRSDRTAAREGCGQPYLTKPVSRIPPEPRIEQHRVMEKELAQRENDGIAVRLLWDTETDGLTVSVQDWRTGEAFELTAEPQRAMDVFHHPYAYASRGGAEVAALEDAVYA